MVIKIVPGEISSPTYVLTYEGAITASFAGLPTGKATVKLKGMDAIMSKLQEAGGDPMAQQGMAALVGAKGLGKADPDGSLVWVIESTPTGQVMVNGLDMSAMMGMAPPPQP